MIGTVPKMQSCKSFARTSDVQQENKNTVRRRIVLGKIEVPRAPEGLLHVVSTALIEPVASVMLLVKTIWWQNWNRVRPPSR